MRKGEIQDGI